MQANLARMREEHEAEITRMCLQQAADVAATDAAARVAATENAAQRAHELDL